MLFAWELSEWFSTVLRLLIRRFKSFRIRDNLATQEHNPQRKKKNRTKSKLVLQSKSSDMAKILCETDSL